MMNYSEINNSEIIAFKPKSGETEFQIVLDENNNTVWATEQQIVGLFGKARRTIGEHIKNIYVEGELDQNSTWREFRQVQKEGVREVSRNVSLYNLDVIISVGYRVKSKVGIEFRKWATTKLKDHLIKGYSINEKRLNQLKQSFKLLKTTIDNDKLDAQQIREVVDVLSDYALSLKILDGYDHQNLELGTTSKETTFRIDYDEATQAIEELKHKFGGSKLFGNEKDNSFKSSISTIDQTFGGNDLYPSIEEKAANLLYFVVKNHSFSDGNKRIAA